MNKKDQQEFKKLIKEGTLEVLGSDEGRKTIKDGTLEAFKSEEGREVIKEESVRALKSEEGRDILTESFADGFHEVIVPVLEDMSKDIKDLKSDIRYMRDNHEDRIEKLERKLGVPT